MPPGAPGTRAGRRVRTLYFMWDIGTPSAARGGGGVARASRVLGRPSVSPALLTEGPAQQTCGQTRGNGEGLASDSRGRPGLPQPLCSSRRQKTTVQRGPRGPRIRPRGRWWAGAGPRGPLPSPARGHKRPPALPSSGVFSGTSSTPDPFTV